MYEREHSLRSFGTRNIHNMHPGGTRYKWSPILGLAMKNHWIHKYYRIWDPDFDFFWFFQILREAGLRIVKCFAARTINPSASRLREFRTFLTVAGNKFMRESTRCEVLGLLRIGLEALAIESESLTVKSLKFIKIIEFETQILKVCENYFSSVARPKTSQRVLSFINLFPATVRNVLNSHRRLADGFRVLAARHFTMRSPVSRKIWKNHKLSKSEFQIRWFLWISMILPTFGFDSEGFQTYPQESQNFAASAISHKCIPGKSQECSELAQVTGGRVYSSRCKRFRYAKPYLPDIETNQELSMILIDFLWFFQVSS